MVDDDPKLPLEQAPAGRPADDQPETPTEPPEGEQPEGEQAEKEATSDEQLDLGDEDDEQDDDDEDEGEGEEDDEPKRKRTGSERYRRQAERLRAENEALRARTSGALPPDQVQLQRAFEARVYEQIGDPPKEEDYQGNYVALERARQVYEFDKRTVMRETAKEFKTAIAQEQERVSNLVADHKERVQRFRTKVKDFDEVMAKATLPVAPHVERILLNSKKSERLSYVLGRNQSKLAQLNRMNPEDAAREIGRLEGRLSLPQPKTQTQARKPITPLKGSGASPPSERPPLTLTSSETYGDRA